MAIELLEDRAGIITLVPDVLPDSAAVSFFKPSSSTAIQTGAGSVQSVGLVSVPGSPGTASISAVTSQTQITVDDATNIEAGTPMWLEAEDGWVGKVVVSEIDGLDIVLRDPPPGTIAVSDTLEGMAITFTVSAASTADRGMNFRAEWAVTDVNTSVVSSYQQIIHVVRTQFRAAVVAGDVARYMDAQFQRYDDDDRDAGFYVEIADRASARVRRQIQAAGAYPHLVGDSDAFVDAGTASLQLELAALGLVPPGWDPTEYNRDRSRTLRSEIGSALKAMQWIDDNDDGIAETTEVRNLYAVKLVRQ